MQEMVENASGFPVLDILRLKATLRTIFAFGFLKV
jgi:hypothetical protein